MKPVDRQVTDTYVSQYVPLPFEAMKKKSKEMNDENIAAEKGINSIYANFNQDFNKYDRPILRQKSDEVHNTINGLLENHGGEPRKIAHEVRNLSRNTQNWLSTKEGKVALDNRKTELALIDKMEKAEMPTSSKNKGLFYAQDRYEIEGGAVNGASYRNLQPYKSVDLNKKLNDLISSLKKDTDSTIDGYFGIDEEKGIIYNGNLDKGGLSKKRIMNAIKSLKTDVDFNSMIDYEYEIDSFYAQYRKDPKTGEFEEIPLEDREGLFSIEEEDKRKEIYKEAKWNSMVDGTSIIEAHQYSERKERMNAKQMRENSNGAIKPNGIPGFNVTSTVNKTAEQSYTNFNTALKDSKDQVQEIINQEANDYNEVFGFGSGDINDSLLFSELSINNPSAKESAEGYAEFIGGFLKETFNKDSAIFEMFDSYSNKESYDILKNNLYLQKRVTEELASGKIDLEDYNGGLTAEQFKHVKERASSIVEKQRERDQLIYDGISYLKKQGVITQEQFNDVKAVNKAVNVMKTNFNIQSMTEGMDPESKKKFKQSAAVLFNKMEGFNGGFITEEMLVGLEKEFNNLNAISKGKLAASEMFKRNVKSNIPGFSSPFSYEERSDNSGVFVLNEEVKKLAKTTEGQLLKGDNKKKMNNYLKDRAAKALTTNIPVNQSDVEVQVNGGRISVSKYLTKKDTGQKKSIIQNHEQAILALPSKAGEKEGFTIDQDLKKRAMKDALGAIYKNDQSIKDLTGQDKVKYNDAYNKYKADLMNNVLFLNELSGSGDFQVTFDSRYVVPMNESSLRIEGFEELFSPEVKAEMWVNSLLTKSRSTAATRFPVPNTKGIYLSAGKNKDEMRFIIDNSMEEGEETRDDGKVYALSKDSNDYKTFRRLLVKFKTNPDFDTEGLTHGQWVLKQLSKPKKKIENFSND
jgi:hypothetical protein